MSNNALRTPLWQSLPQLIDSRIADAFQKTGKALPCQVIAVTGAIVTIEFTVQSGFTLPNIQVPVGMSKYVQLPIMPGDQGVVFPCDTSIANVSGLGAGVPDLTQPGNLSALVFFPVSNAEWVSLGPGILGLVGPLGFSFSSGNSSIVATNDALAITFGGHSIILSAAGIAIDGVNFLTHEHTFGTSTGPIPPAGQTGPVVP